MFSSRVLFVVYVVLGFVGTTCSQSQVRTISSNDGLTQVSIHALLKDRNGYIWIGTQDGLNRFDGHSIRSYRYDARDSTGLAGNMITTLFQDKASRIWIGTANRGVCYYDPDQGKFYIPSIVNEGPDVINKGTVTDICEDLFGRVWINTLSHGVYFLSHSEDNRFELSTVPLSDGNETSTALHITREGIMWVGTSDGRLFYGAIDERLTNFSLVELPLEESMGMIHCIVSDPKTTWIGTERGLWCFSPENGMESIGFPIEADRRTSDHIIYDLKLDADSALWVATGNGLYSLREKNKEGMFAKTVRYDEQTDIPISHNTVYSLLQDGKNTWIGTAKNLDIYDFSEPRFRVLSPSDQSELSNPIVFSIYKNDHGLWVGTAGGLHLFTGEKVYCFKENVNDNTAISDDIIRAITPDHHGNIWIGTTHGVSIIQLKSFNPEKPVFKNVYFDPNNSESLSHNHIRDIVIDRMGNLWLATYGGGICRFIGDVAAQDIRFQNFRHIPKDINSLSSDIVHCIKNGLNNDIWIGTQEGLDKLSFTSNEFDQYQMSHFKSETSDSGAISDNSIHAIHFDQNDELWVGTGYGLNKYNSDDGSFLSLFAADGLPNDVIYSIQEDNSNNLWVGTNGGLVHVNSFDHSMTSYFTKDGIADNEFNILSNYMDDQGTLYMGGVNGLTFFKPESVLRTDGFRPVIVTDYLAPCQEVDGSHKYMKMLPFAAEESLDLMYDQFPIYLRIASPLSGPFNEPEYYYKIHPVDKQWHHLGERREIQLLNLSPGSYNLHLTGGKGGDIWESHYCSLPITIHPPWWRSWFAILMYVLAISSLVYWIARLIYKRRLSQRENMHLKEVESTMSKFYSNITHEFRTPLTVILGMADHLNSNFNERHKQEFDESLNMIKRNSYQLLDLVNQLLDMTKLSKGHYSLNLIQQDLVQFLKYQVRSLHSYAQLKGVSLMEYIEEDVIVMDFSPKAIERILNNLITNAVKFSKKGDQIVVHLKKDESSNEVILKIKDEGKGIAPSEIPKIFNRFYQVDDDTTREHDGSGIGLSMVKELVELFAGQISVKSKLGYGSEFTIRIPITNQAELKKIEPPKISGVKKEIPIETIDVTKKDADVVLIVEDNRDIAQYISTCIQDRFSIRYCKNGLQASLVAVELLPDIIISDVMMPQMDGFELCKKLKENALTNHIPIILLTARISQKDRLHGLHCGADAYLKKPFNPEELNIRIDQLILLRKELRSKYSDPGNWNRTNGTDKLLNEDQFLARVKRCIMDNVDNGEYRAIHLARDMAVSESQLYRKLKATTDKSTALLIRSVRLYHASYLLQTTRQSISEIAYDCGFNDSAYFSRVFKNEFGQAPTEYREFI